MSRPPARRRRQGTRSAEKHDVSQLYELAKFVRDHSLSLTLFALFLVSLGTGLFAGLAQRNETLTEHNAVAIGYWAFLKSGSFWEALSVNWQAALLQLATIIVFSEFLFERGATHSRNPRKTAARPTLTKRPLRWLYGHSLSVAFFGLFFAALLVHAFAGEATDNGTRALHGKPPLSFGEYLISAKFWWSNLQTWQAEYLVIAVYLVLSIFLREKKSAESKPVSAEHTATGESNK